VKKRAGLHLAVQADAAAAGVPSQAGGVTLRPAPAAVLDFRVRSLATEDVWDRRFTPSGRASPRARGGTLTSLYLSSPFPHHGRADRGF